MLNIDTQNDSPQRMDLMWHVVRPRAVLGLLSSLLRYQIIPSFEIDVFAGEPQNKKTRTANESCDVLGIVCLRREHVVAELL